MGNRSSYRSQPKYLSNMGMSNYPVPPQGAYGGYSMPSSSGDISCVIPPSNGVGGLYLSNIHPAKDYQLLQYLGIRAVLTTAAEAGVHYDHSIVPYHLIVNAEDSSRFHIAQYFDQAADFIRRCLRSTNVLVHCMAGVSRSATLTMAYLIADRGMTFQSALSYVRQCRPMINPNAGFQAQLKEYEMLLSQRRGNHLKNSTVYAPSSNIGSSNALDAPYRNNYGSSPFRFSGIREGFY